YSSGGIDQFIKSSQPISLNFDGGLNMVKTKKISKQLIKKGIDVVFPALHGTYGEDGSLMGLLDIANVAYVGCGLRASAVAMDKVLTKQIAEQNNIPVTKFLSFKADRL